MRITFRWLPAVLCCVALAGRIQGQQAFLIEDAGFIPSGWMGDGAMKVDKPEKSPVQVNPLSTVDPHTPPYCQQWSYRPKFGQKGWAAVAWQFPENNWGDKPAKDWSKRGFSKVTVWARGIKDRHGNLPKVQFKAGGGSDPTKKYQASFEVENDFMTLTEDWKQYSLDLRGQNLSQVIAAFVLVVRAQDVDPDGATFFLDDIAYQ
jgi:hypothetical protein